MNGITAIEETLMPTNSIKTRFVTERTLQVLLREKLLSHWHEPLCLLCQRYNGPFFEWISHESQNPLNQIYDLFKIIDPNKTTDEQIAHMIADLDFLSWRVKNPDTGDRWNCLDINLDDFCVDFTQYPVAWQWESSHPPKDQIISWLLIRVALHI